MKASVLFLTIVSLTWSMPVDAKNFTLQREIRGNDFFSDFYWWSYADPTKGYVDYLTKAQAQEANLSYVNDQGNFVMQVDHTTLLADNDTVGRKSVRIQSNDLMSDGVLLAKLVSMPTGLATWPALWTCTTDTWPSGGEIDIVEGANNQGPRNLVSLHTQSGCSIPSGQGTVSNRNDTGYSSDSNCDHQPGCSVQTSVNNTFGINFNQNGGGYFAMVRDTVADGAGISVYFWPMSATGESLPSALSYPALAYLQTDTNVTSSAYTTQSALWSTPIAHFPNLNSSCAMQNYFEPHQIIFDITLCGTWAGETFQYVSNLGNITCEEYVRDNPTAFEDARFEVEYIRVYGTDSASRIALPFSTAAISLSLSMLSALLLSLA
ncbi:hypothetical protein CBS101457_006573 [Exobasidium rhododendri]|nr:hypothetical protein CBS101457_006573 [Exobasidium rhododendri]